MAREKQQAPKEPVPVSSQGFELEEHLVCINRTSKTVKGGRNMSFAALVVVGDKHGQFGYGYAKAGETANAIKKAGEMARKNLITIPMVEGTIPHMIQGKFRGSKVILRPAAPGTGVIAGGAMRYVFTLGGITDILSKSLGANNPANMVKATAEAIRLLRTKADIAAKLGKNEHKEA